MNTILSLYLAVLDFSLSFSEFTSHNFFFRYEIKKEVIVTFSQFRLFFDVEILCLVILFSPSELRWKTVQFVR